MEPVNIMEITPMIMLPYMKKRDFVDVIKVPNQLNRRQEDDLNGADLIT